LVSRLSLKFEKSSELYERALRVMVAGVSSPVRAFKAVGGKPLFITRGSGSRIWDQDGNCFIDYVCSWGALILGHSHPIVQREAIKAIKNGSSFGAPVEAELLLAESICSSIPSIEMVRFVNSGTEATMSALRLARAYTKRNKIIKFEGCYHGHVDPFLSRAGSGLATLDIPSSEGVTKAAVANTITIPYNNIDVLEEAFKNYSSDIAAIMVEPVAGNMGVVLPERHFLESARKLCDENGSLLIFDEVITGFRVSRRGAQGLFDVKPDITCLGKIIGGGFPVGAYGSSREMMRMLSPVGQVYQAGTLSGNPVAMRAGLATISLLDKRAYEELEDASSSLEKGLLEVAEKSGIELRINRAGSMMGLFFTSRNVNNFEDVKNTNYKLYSKFFWLMLKEGVYLPPSPFESIFISSAHSEDDISSTIRGTERAFKQLR
jgi:glutamate-1-semialdehyde 2,1-aminomutase